MSGVHRTGKTRAPAPYQLPARRVRPSNEVIYQGESISAPLPSYGGPVTPRHGRIRSIDMAELSASVNHKRTKVNGRSEAGYFRPSTKRRRESAHPLAQQGVPMELINSFQPQPQPQPQPCTPPRRPAGLVRNTATTKSITMAYEPAESGHGVDFSASRGPSSLARNNTATRSITMAFEPAETRQQFGYSAPTYVDVEMVEALRGELIKVQKQNEALYRENLDLKKENGTLEKMLKEKTIENDAFREFMLEQVNSPSTGRNEHRLQANETVASASEMYGEGEREVEVEPTPKGKGKGRALRRSVAHANLTPLAHASPSTFNNTKYSDDAPFDNNWNEGPSLLQKLREAVDRPSSPPGPEAPRPPTRFCGKAPLERTPTLPMTPVKDKRMAVDLQLSQLIERYKMFRLGSTPARPSAE